MQIYTDFSAKHCLYVHNRHKNSLLMIVVHSRWLMKVIHHWQMCLWKRVMPFTGMICCLCSVLTCVVVIIRICCRGSCTMCVAE